MFFHESQDRFEHLLVNSLMPHLPNDVYREYVHRFPDDDDEFDGSVGASIDISCLNDIYIYPQYFDSEPLTIVH